MVSNNGRVPTAHSGPYASQDPNLSDEEKYSQAGLILAKIEAGDSISKIARELDLSRDTVYARLKLISRQLPDGNTARLIQFERLEYLWRHVTERLDSDVSNADAARLLGEGRQLSARLQAIFESAPPSPSDDLDQIDDDDWEVAEGVGAD